MAKEDSEKVVEDIALENEEVDEEIEQTADAVLDPDEFYAKQAFRVVYQTNNFLLPQIRDLINGRQLINIRPEYQRRLRWKTPQKSRLIESLLLNIPVPPVFLFESQAARYEVMDGQQRLNAITEFLNNEFKLSSLSVLWPLNGLKYSDCPPRIKRGLDRAVISAIVLLLESDVETVEGKNVRHSDIRRFIFDRLNTAGTRLNAQELRNAIYPGAFNDMIISAARGALFTAIWGIPAYSETDPSEYYENPKRQKNSLYATMMDCQIVLRFFALRVEDNISGSMKGILDHCMESNAKMTTEQAKLAQEYYLQRLHFAHELFDSHPFELPKDSKGKTRMSVALYDAIMVGIDRSWDKRDALLKRGPEVRSEIEALLKDDKTSTLITGQGNTAKTTKERIALVARTLQSFA